MTPLAVAAALGLAGCATSAAGSGPTSSASSASAASSGATSGAGVTSAGTAQVVTAAKAFLRTLSADQRATVVRDFDDPVKKSGWSNLPTNVVKRTGIALGDLTGPQRQAVMAVLQAALSDQGYRQVQDIMAADDHLAQLQASGQAIPPGPGGPSAFGSGLYHVTFFGEPSTRSAFELQLTGHHLAQNITYSGGRVSLAPEFVGVEPPVFTEGGRSYQALAQESSSMTAMIDALSPAQRSAAQIPGSCDDLLLGAQNDGPFPAQPEGVLVSDLSPQQQGLVTAAVRAWVGDLDERAADALMTRYTSQYDQTRIGWSGATTLGDINTYLRIDGPGVWIEFSDTAGRVTNQVHYHTVYRDQTDDYAGS